MFEEPKHYMGIDPVFENENAYCLFMKHGDDSRIILCKSIPDKNKFNDEVNNLCKYFNAVKLTEKNDGMVRKTSNKYLNEIKRGAVSDAVLNQIKKLLYDV